MLKSQGAARRAAFGFIRFHTAAGADTAAYGYIRPLRGDTVAYGRCAGRSFIKGPLCGESDFYEEIHVDYC
jgi:hypothetical protein